MTMLFFTIIGAGLLLYAGNTNIGVRGRSPLFLATALAISLFEFIGHAYGLTPLLYFSVVSAFVYFRGYRSIITGAIYLLLLGSLGHFSGPSTDSWLAPIPSVVLSLAIACMLYLDLLDAHRRLLRARGQQRLMQLPLLYARLALDLDVHSSTGSFTIAPVLRRHFASMLRPNRSVRLTLPDTAENANSEFINTFPAHDDRPDKGLATIGNDSHVLPIPSNPEIASIHSSIDRITSALDRGDRPHPGDFLRIGRTLFPHVVSMARKQYQIIRKSGPLAYQLYAQDRQRELLGVRGHIGYKDVEEALLPSDEKAGVLSIRVTTSSIRFAVALLDHDTDRAGRVAKTLLRRPADYSEDEIHGLLSQARGDFAAAQQSNARLVQESCFSPQLEDQLSAILARVSLARTSLAIGRPRDALRILRVPLLSLARYKDRFVMSIPKDFNEWFTSAGHDLIPLDAFLAMVYATAATGRFDHAFKVMRHAVRKANSIAATGLSVGSDAQRLAFLHFPLQVLHLAISLTSRCPRASYRSFAYELVLRWKALSLDAASNLHRQTVHPKSPRIAVLIEQLSIVKRKIIGLEMQHTASADIESELNQLQYEREALEAELTQRVPGIASDILMSPQTFESLRSVLPVDAALIEFVRFLANDRFDGVEMCRWKYAAFIVRSDRKAPELLTLADDASTVDALVVAFREACQLGAGNLRDLFGSASTAQPSYDPAAGEGLRRAIMDPLRVHLEGIKQLIIAPDGQLSLVPFETLPASDDGMSFLGERFSIGYVSVGRDLFRGASLAQCGPALVVADPSYDLSKFQETRESSLEHGEQLGTPASLESATPRRQQLSSAVFERRPWMRVEGERVAALLGVPPLLGDAAIVTSVTSVASPRILHIATHGFFQAGDDDPAGSLGHSGLALAGANTWLGGGLLPAAAGTGLLTADEVSRWNLRGTEIVVLSACVSGLGSVQLGQGVFGLRRAFALAGARTVLLTLWSVSDAPTMLLVERFFENLIERRLTRLTALRDAQAYVRDLSVQQLLDHPCAEGFRSEGFMDGPADVCPFAHPFFWGAFILQGVGDEPL